MTEAPDSESYDLISLEYQGLYTVHANAACAGTSCCIHAPSDHHMVGWPMMFSQERGYLAYRVCAHGVPHPDPDSLAYMVGRLGETAGLFLALHSCEGCCTKEGFIGAR